MAESAPEERLPDPRVTAERYLQLVEDGVLGGDDRVELLEGVVVSMAPHSPQHAAGIQVVTDAVRRAVGIRALVRAQLPFVAGTFSVPEPDVAVVPGATEDYFDRHPSRAFLVVEVAHSSLAQDRLTKAPMYAAAAIPEYWIVNVVDGVVEVFREPTPRKRRYATCVVVHPDDEIELVALPACRLAVRDLIPRRRDG